MMNLGFRCNFVFVSLSVIVNFLSMVFVRLRVESNGPKKTSGRTLLPSTSFGRFVGMGNRPRCAECINIGLKVKVENVAVIIELGCASEFNLLAYHNVL